MSGFPSGLKSLSGLTFAVRDLFEAQKKNHDAFEVISARLLKLEDRMTHLEARENMLIVQAGAAASAAATDVASSMTLEIATRLTRIGERMKRLPDGGSRRVSSDHSDQV